MLMSILMAGAFASSSHASTVYTFEPPAYAPGNSPAQPPFQLNNLFGSNEIVVFNSESIASGVFDTGTQSVNINRVSTTHFGPELGLPVSVSPSAAFSYSVDFYVPAAGWTNSDRPAVAIMGTSGVSTVVGYWINFAGTAGNNNITDSSGFLTNTRIATDKWLRLSLDVDPVGDESASITITIADEVGTIGSYTRGFLNDLDAITLVKVYDRSAVGNTGYFYADNLAIIPEPRSVAALLGLAALFWVIRRKAGK